MDKIQQKLEKQIMRLKTNKRIKKRLKTRKYQNMEERQGMRGE